MFRKLLLAMLLLLPAFAGNITITPSYASVEVNSTLVFTVKFSGIAGLKTLRIYGPFVDVGEKKIWISPYGKDFTFEFTPEAPGRYTITVEVVEDNLRSSAVVDVFERSREYEMLEEEVMEVMKKEGNTTEVTELLKLLKEGKLELVKIKLQELKEKPYLYRQESSVPLKVVLLLVLAVISAILVKAVLR